MEEPMWDCTRKRAVGRRMTEDERIHLEVQIMEDTCLDHNAYLCEVCFDMTPVEDE